MADERLLRVAIDREPIKVARQMGYGVHRLSPKDVVDKGDYETGYRFRLSKPDPSKPFPETVMARSESEVAAFLRRKIGTMGNPLPEVEVPKAVVRYKRNYGVGRSVYFVEYEYNGERYITGTIIRGTNRSLGWYFGKGPEGLKEANRIVLLSDEEFDKAEYLPQHSWERQKEKLKARPPVAEPSNPAPEVTPGFYVLKPISAEAKDWVTILSEDYKRTPEGNILVRPSDMEQIGKLIREDYLDITKDFTVARPRTAGNPDAKEPWQMTRAEHLEAARTWRQEYMPRLKGQALEDELRKVDEGHRRTVEYALVEGKPVPPEVLADYPELARKANPPAVEEVPEVMELEDVGREWDKLTVRQRQPIVERANLLSSFAIRDWAELPLSKKDAIRMSFPKPPAVEGGNPVRPRTERERLSFHERIFGKGSAPPTGRLGRGQAVNDFMPMPPDSGPPLPRILGLKWPWKE